MLSAILPRDKSHPTTFSDLHDLVWLQRIVAGGNDSVDLDATLLDQAPRVAVGLRKAAGNECLHEANRKRDRVLIDLVRRFALTKLLVEVLLGPAGLVLAVQALHELAGES